MATDAGDMRSAREHHYVRTSCGRDLTIGRLALGNSGHPVGRVFVDLGDCPDCESRWAGLSVAVTAEFAMAADRPARVGAVRLLITVPGGVPPQRTDALLAVASHCTVHNTLRQQPDVSIELS